MRNMTRGFNMMNIVTEILAIIIVLALSLFSTWLLLFVVLIPIAGLICGLFLDRKHLCYSDYTCRDISLGLCVAVMILGMPWGTVAGAMALALKKD